MNQLFYQFRYALPVWICQILTSWLPDNRISIKIRGGMVALFLPGRPKGLTLGRDVTLLGIDKLDIGTNVYLAKGVWINALGGMTIKDEVMFAPYVVAVTTKHGFKNNSVFHGRSHFKAVSIGRGSWIAAHCTITAGVNIGNGCIIGANSVLTKSTRDNVIVAGVPAKEIQERLETTTANYA